ncbi:thioredoxin family protein [Lewinellaceae bacterium SD302]|nr:thioredoxin family protein [Lewinellaceae bacterium SD302]
MTILKSTFSKLAIAVALLCFTYACNNNDSNLATQSDSTQEAAHRAAEPKDKGDKRPGPPPHGGKRPSPVEERSLTEIGGYQLGDVATDFSLSDVDGKMVSLADTPDAKGYVIAFTCNECPFAKMYEDRLNALSEKWTPMGYPVIAINSNGGKGPESLAAMQKRAKDKNFSFPYLIDAKQEIYAQYGATRTPHMFILDKDKKVRYIGAIDDSARDADDVEQQYIDDALTQLSNGEAVTTNYTKSIGCPIKKS